jgi:hypothetical protein
MRNKDKGGVATGVLATVVAIVLLVGIVVGGYQLGWWLNKNATNRTAQIYQDSYGRQTALVDSIVDDIKEAQNPNLPKQQRIAIVDQICDNADHLSDVTRLPQHAITFIAQECPQ